MRLYRLLPVFAVVAALFAEVLSAAEVSLYCSFDGSADPTFAAGRDFAVFRRERYAPGRRGQAFFFDRETAPVSLIEPGNLDKARGSLELWLRPDWNGDEPGDHALVWEPGSRKVGAQTIWLWKYGRNIRFDVRDLGDHYLTASIEKWRRGEWHHLVAAWDCRKGTRLYLDGQLAATRDFTWTPRVHARFLLGRRGRGDLPADAAVDELYVYAQPLTRQEARAAFAGTLQRTFASRRQTTPSREQSPAAPPRLLFHASFEGTSKADLAGGAAEPLENRNVTFVQGVVGKAAHFGRGAVLRYAEFGNLKKERGTVVLWFRPDWTAAETRRPDGGEWWRCLFREGPQPARRHGSNVLWLWFWAQRLRFDVSDDLDRYTLTPVSDWTRPAWHHIVVTWDNTRFRRLYLDGELVRGGGDASKPFLAMEWDAKSFPWFAVGSDGRSAFADGAVDEFRIYDAPLSETAVREDLARLSPLRVEAPHRYYRVGEEVRVRWRLRNISSRRVEGRVSWRCVGPDDRTVVNRRLAVNLSGGQSRELAADAKLPAPGRYELTVRWQPDNGLSSSHSVSLWGVSHDARPRAGEPLRVELVEEIDLTADLPGSRFVTSAPARVRRTRAGVYREAGPRKHDRFAVRLHLPNIDRPYFIDWSYPDDAPRTMEMIAQSVADGRQEYELQTGVFCGAEYPLSGRMVTRRCLYWPRSRDVALIFMTCEDGRPAAAAEVRVWRVVGRLPKLPVNAPAPVGGWSRSVGLYYEDPAMCYDFGGYSSMPGFTTTIDRLIEYMEWFGQNLFMYPAVWYQGPFYPSASQGLAMSRPHPPNYLEYMLLRFADHDIGFVPTWNLHHLPSVGDFIWRDEMAATGEAAASPLMVYWDGSPNLSGWHGTGPDYNPLHPRVRAGILNMVDEMLDLYGDLPAFKGICFHLTRHCMLWFGELDAGYNDYCVEAFARDTGIKMPVADDDPGRANRRYRWLMEHARDQWMAWRCRQLHALYADIAARLRRRRPDLKLVLNLYRPTKQEIFAEDADRFERADYVEQVWRESGVDPTLYRSDPNIVIQRTIYPADYRWYRCHRRYTEDPVRVRALNYAPAAFGPLRAVREAWLNMHDRYWEDAVGRREPWKEFWGKETGWRVSTLNPTGRYALESYAIPLARRDLRALTKGGFLVGTIGMEPEVGAFVQAFRALPDVAFGDVSDVSGPVVVRQHADDGGLWFYLVNPTPAPVRVEVRWTGRPRRLRNLATGKETPLRAGVVRVALPAYGVASYRAEGAGVRIAHVAPARE